MTNEEIKNKWYKEEPTFDELLNLARQDEREKMGMKQLTGTDLNKLFELYLDKKLESMLDIDKEVRL